jgi:hypothetical protein
MVETSPSILGYSLENIDSKLRGLKDRGFSNPTKMVETSPSILGYSFENIDRRLRLLRRIISLYKLPYTSVGLMEAYPLLFGSKIDKLLILIRIGRDYSSTPFDISNKIISGFLQSNLEDVLVALNKVEKDTTLPKEVRLPELLSHIRAVKRRKLDKEEKREIIINSPDLDPKIKRRYLRGYPQK